MRIEIPCFKANSNMLSLSNNHLMDEGDVVGYAKYHEDDAELYFERQDALNARWASNALPNYTVSIPRMEFTSFCPFCRTGFVNHKSLINHMLTAHGGNHEFIYLNNKRINGTEQIVDKVSSLMLYSYREDARVIYVLDNLGNEYSFRTEENKTEYNLLRILDLAPFSTLWIKNIDTPVCIRQYIDINTVSIDKIISGKYSSYLFDEQFSEGKFNPKECLIYMKMLINEGSDTDAFIDYINQMHFDASNDLREIYYYHYLNSGSSETSTEESIGAIAVALQCLLNGEYQRANIKLSKIPGHSNDKLGCQLIHSLLINDKLGTDYLLSRYNPEGFIGHLEKTLISYAAHEEITSAINPYSCDELRLFSKYPLIQALIELNNSINNNGMLSHDSYSLLRELTPLAAIHYCFGIDDPLTKEKIIKSMVKVHKESPLIKELAFQSNYDWIKRRIFVSDGPLYKKAVLKQNGLMGHVFSQYFIDNFPFDDQVEITPLGGEHEIGASCFIISYKGYNIMLDCGINVHEYGDVAYPALDSWNRDIDAIIISHAHIDHSGGVPKAHAMWSGAKIISTGPTKIFLKYLYSDMAKVRNGIVDEFEIENINIEKNVMTDTLNAIDTLDYYEWYTIGSNFKFRLHPAGHIIGAAMIEIAVGGRTLLYTGDFCNYNQILTGGFDLHLLPQHIDYLITESTYLNKGNIDWNKQCADLRNAVTKAIDNKQAVLLPAASIGRSQELVCLIGEMKLSGKIPDNIPLYIAGMAIPATTQIMPFMNEQYEKIIGLFREYDGETIPEENSIVIASSGSMSKGSASYKIAKSWHNQNIGYIILANGYLDEDTETENKYMDGLGNTQRFSLSTHADLNGILNLIEYVSPKVISFIHRGTSQVSDYKSFENTCKIRFSNDIMCRDLKANRSERIFDMYEYLMEGVQ